MIPSLTLAYPSYKPGSGARHPGCSTVGRVLVLKGRGNQPPFLVAGAGRMDAACFAELEAQRKSRTSPFNLVLMWPTGKRHLRLWVGRKPVVVRPGEFLVANPNEQVHHDTAHGMEAALVTLGQPLLRECREMVGLPKTAGAFDFYGGSRRLTGASRRAAHQLHQLVMRPAASASAWLPVRVYCAGLELLEAVWMEYPSGLKERLAREGTAAVLDERVRLALDYLKAHLAEPLENRALADQVGLSRPSLYRLFQESLNQTPRDVLVRFRVEAAERLLNQPHPPKWQQVAEEVGFLTATGLRRAMKTVRGHPR